MSSSFTGRPNTRYGEVPVDSLVLVAIQFVARGGLNRHGDVGTGVDRDGGLRRK